MPISNVNFAAFRPRKLEMCNERLEFLGDAVLTFLSTEFLYNLDSDKDEGELTRLRSNLVVVLFPGNVGDGDALATVYQCLSK